jgi:uncharacterized repeat protein (TIGR04076 family)
MRQLGRLTLGSVAATLHTTQRAHEGSTTMAGSNGVPIKLEVTEILVGGECPVGIVPGQVWEIRDGIVPQGMCAAAWNAIQPYVVALRYGGKMPWSGEAEMSACCPDPANPVVFKLTVIDE